MIHSGVKLSEASKKLGKKFATGASVVKVRMFFIVYKILDKFASEYMLNKTTCLVDSRDRQIRSILMFKGIYPMILLNSLQTPGLM